MLSDNILQYAPTSSEANGTFGSGIGTSPLPLLEADIASIKRPTIAIMSLGEMGIGIAALLAKYSYPVITSLDGRSEKTKARAAAAGVKNLPFVDMLCTADVILSIVPPAGAYEMAVKTATASAEIRSARKPDQSSRQRVYMDLNAISPDLARQIGKVLDATGMLYIDGAIIGLPPRAVERDDGDNVWFRPSIPVAGPDLKSAVAAPWTQNLISLLQIRHVSKDLGAASGLKMCFGAIYKGQAAVATQAYVTSKNLGVLPALRAHMAEYFPHIAPIIENSLIGSQRKAYRWIQEMEEIEETFVTEAGWQRGLFGGVAQVFDVVAHQTSLEADPKTEVEDIAKEICIGLHRMNGVKDHAII